MQASKADEHAMGEVKERFSGKMDDDLDVKGAFDALYDFFDVEKLKEPTPSIASGYVKALEAVDQVLQVFFKDKNSKTVF